MKNKPITRKKDIIRLIKKMAKELPPLQYEYLEKYNRPHYRDEKGEIWPTKELAEKEGGKSSIIFATINKRDISHSRRIKKLYNQYGIRACKAYLEYYSKKEENASETKI